MRSSPYRLGVHIAALIGDRRRATWRRGSVTRLVTDVVLWPHQGVEALFDGAPRATCPDVKGRARECLPHGRVSLRLGLESITDRLPVQVQQRLDHGDAQATERVVIRCCVAQSDRNAKCFAWRPLDNEVRVWKQRFDPATALLVVAVRAKDAVVQCAPSLVLSHSFCQAAAEYGRPPSRNFIAAQDRAHPSHSR